jgi:uncharacterized membrane protein
VQDYLPLIGIPIVIVGFLLRLNPLAVVTAAALATGLAAGKALVDVVAILGKAFNDSRYVSIVWIALPVIGLLERYGLQQQARRVITSLRSATTGRLLLLYLLFRQITSALGLTSIAGHAQTVRPLVAPMAEAAAERDGPLDDAARERVKAMAAATDNVGLFFGEDIFIAIGSILLIVGFLDQNGIQVAPLELSVWAIPTAVIAFMIHGVRLWRMDRGGGPNTPGPARPERSRGATAPNAPPPPLDFARDERNEDRFQ